MHSAQSSDFEAPIACHRRPSDRFYAALHWTLIGILFLYANYVIWGSRLVNVPRPVGFRLVVLAITCFNIVWWSVADRRLARHVRSDFLARILRIAIAFLAIGLLAPVVYIVIAGQIPLFLNSPTWYAQAFTFWHISLAVALPIVAGLRLAFISMNAIVRRIRSKSRVEDVAPTAISPVVEGDVSRRALLRTAFASVPVMALSAGTLASRWQENHFEVNRHQLPAPWLPERLRGLTITQVSDLHVGRLYRPYMLSRLVDEVARLNSDIVVVTGDIVDNSNDVLPPAVEALAQLPHRHGIFLCIGNHDEFDDRDRFIRYVQPRLPLLLNERRTLSIGGEKLTMAGISFAYGQKDERRRAGDFSNVLRTFQDYDRSREGPPIVLAHHPHAWDVLRDYDVPLTLSGHTHGGQVMLTPPGMRPAIGLGNLLFKYMSGWYGTDTSKLFVNRGVGNWFPVRVNAPAEIVQIQLV